MFTSYHKKLSRYHMVSRAKEAAEYKLYEGAVQQHIALQEIHSFLHSVTNITGFSITPRIFPSHFPHFFISGTRSLEVSMSWTLTTRSQRCFRQINAPYRTVCAKRYYSKVQSPQNPVAVSTYTRTHDITESDAVRRK